MAHRVFRILGFVLCILPPFIAAVDQFPVMAVEGKAATLLIFAAVLCFIPLFKHVKHLLRSPSAWLMWGVIFAFCAVIRPIIDEFYIISSIGLVSSVLGGVCFLVARRLKKEG